VVLDGVDGSGTTTHSRILAGTLESKGYKVYLTQEPSNSEIGLLIRRFLKNDNVPRPLSAYPKNPLTLTFALLGAKKYHL